MEAEEEEKRVEVETGAVEDREKTHHARLFQICPGIHSKLPDCQEAKSGTALLT